MGSNPVAVTSPSDFAPASSKEFLDIQATIECGFTLKRVRDMIKTYSQMHRTDKYSQHSSIIWPAWLNGWVFVYELSGCGFESSCSHFTFRFRACFEQGVPWHSGNYRVWIHSETRTWHDKNIQSIFSLTCVAFLYFEYILIFCISSCAFATFEAVCCVLEPSKPNCR